MKGILILLVFWFLGFCLTKWPILNVPFATLKSSRVILEPLTVPEKILLGFRLPINNLSESDWESLPNIGPKLAKKIVNFRDQYGPFKKVEEVLGVPGMGEKTLALIAPFLKP